MTAGPRRRRRWGLRTLGFLALAFVAVVTSAASGAHTAGTFGSLILGLSGATYCSVQGLRGALDDDTFTMIVGARRRP